MHLRVMITTVKVAQETIHQQSIKKETNNNQGETHD
jgi:hypothetical protein